MTIVNTVWGALQRAGQLIYQGNDMSPRSGVWITRISREAVLAQVLCMLAVLAFNVLLWWIGGRTEKLWLGIALTMSAIPLALVSTGLAHWLDKQPDRPPSNAVFWLWAGLTALLAIPLAHLMFFLSQQIYPIAAKSAFVRHFPEWTVGLVVAFSYWRLVVVRLWYERLATEELKRHAAEQGQALAEARLLTLQSQIEPHFLFNTLASVQHLVRKDPPQADFLLTQLISYLRQTVSDARGTASTLEREFASVQTYLDIVRVRMGGRLTVTVDCEAALAEVPFPALVVHTLVENAIKHGVEMKTGPVAISVSARRSAQGITVSVQDNGVGFGAADTVGGGLGLRNIRDRLALSYQGAARLDINDAAGGGVCASVTIPGN